MFVPDFIKLTKKELTSLLEVFKIVKNVEFPSILEQLRGKHHSRRLIDSAWLEVLKYQGDIDGLLDKLYDSLAIEIELLKGIMTER